MSYRKDPRKRLAELLNNALNKRHTYAVIWVATDRLELTGCDQRWLSSYAAWHPGCALVNIRDHLATLPRVTC